MNEIIYRRNCPYCGNEIIYSSKGNLKRAVESNSSRCCHQKRGPCPEWVRRKISISHKGSIPWIKGKHHSEETRNKIKLKRALQTFSEETRNKLRNAASNQPRRFGKAVDKGQVEIIKKWNQLGFKFEVNYKLHTNDFLYFIDGYDKEKNVVLEYDSKYHNIPQRKQKDLIRQNNIINILNPNKFWRYDAVNKQCRNVLEKI